MSILITILEGVYLLIAFIMAVQAIFNIRLRLFIWETPEHAWLNSAPTVYLDPCLTFTILLPARHEEEVLRETMQKIYDLNYPKDLLQIIAICREDDPNTIAEAQAKIDELGDPNVQLLVFNDKPINKPHGLNLALQVARGDVVTIFDAEDEPHPDILNIINTTMLTEDIDVVQSGVQLMNHNTKWFCFLNVLEYFFWFKSSLHFFANVGMTPLGGNTVFVRRELMETLGGWDETCLTEDADLGIRLALSHARMRVIYDDEFVTREETPHTIEQFIKQRTRWNQGFIQILFKGEWLKLESLYQRLLAFYVLVLPEVQAFFTLLVPVSLLTFFFIKLPLWISLLTFLPLYIFIMGIFIDQAGLYEFLKAHGRSWSIREAAIMLFASVPYQFLLGLGALRAVARFIQGATNWEKTAHIGQHRQKELNTFI
ncbi:glycosyltransferase [Ktedonobacter racemifer]|uniref:Glycosyl transferase family 2 n=1 Tax=Ktedonobacter racemifer DSM 44963 TaxID=485913 RepID=D6TN16_KTERA|nr:glycosyltransferase [Ktedonobacter racemifer]EFH87166.1 glycosyl transferase family 2 [Ktedonobacter racemifer DSM 44963]